jgi:hypothetical protein
MLVNATQYPGPAMFQGIALILIAIFVVCRATLWKDDPQPAKKPKATPEEQIMSDEFFLKLWAVFCLVLLSILSLVFFI